MISSLPGWPLLWKSQRLLVGEGGTGALPRCVFVVVMAGPVAGWSGGGQLTETLTVSQRCGRGGAFGRGDGPSRWTSRTDGPVAVRARGQDASAGLRARRLRLAPAPPPVRGGSGRASPGRGAERWSPQPPEQSLTPPRGGTTVTLRRPGPGLTPHRWGVAQRPRLHADETASAQEALAPSAREPDRSAPHRP